MPIHMTFGRLAIYLAAAAGGSAAGYLMTDLILKKIEDRERLENDSEEVETYSDADATEEAEDLYRDRILSKRTEEFPITPKEKKTMKAGKKTDYTKFTKKGDLGELARHYSSSIADIEEEKPVDRNVPRVITYEDYMTNNGHDKVEITYYEKDDTLTDVAGKVVSSPDNLVGPDALSNFGQKSEDPDIVYIGNDKMETDFEIVRLKGSYTEIVLGVPEETRSRSKNRKVNKKNVNEELEEAEE